MTPPTTQQIKAVREVIYDKKTVRKLSDDIETVNTSLNPGGDGLQWTYLDNGQVTSDILTAAQRARSLASTLTKIANRIGALSSIPADDRRNLVAAFTAQAAAWTARSRAWLSQETSSTATRQQAQTIHSHEADAVSAAKKVSHYFKQTDPINSGTG